MNRSFLFENPTFSFLALFGVFLDQMHTLDQDGVFGRIDGEDHPGFAFMAS